MPLRQLGDSYVCSGLRAQFGAVDYGHRDVAKPHAGGDSAGGDRRDFLGGFAISGVDETLSRGYAGKGRGRADIWNAVSGGPVDAAAHASVADDGELVGCQSNWDDVFIFVWAGSTDVSGDASAATKQLGLSEYVVWSGCGGAVGGVHELHCADCEGNVRIRDEHGIGAG